MNFSRRGPHYLLIDGHNLMHADAEMRQALSEPERARAQLEQLLSANVRRSERVLVFYDGGPGGEAVVRTREGMSARYSGRDEADEYVVAWLRSHSEARAALVSDDRELRGRARALGATLINCDTFLATLSSTRPNAGIPPARDQLLSAHEVDDWLRIFGIDE